MHQEAANAAPTVSLANITKSFPGIRALDGVSLDLYPGEVHVIMGENGAGKSTLMKILCGAFPADAGSYLYQGEALRMTNPREARKLGIAVIFQELSLVPHLDIAQNIYLGREPVRGLPGQVDRRALYAGAKAILAALGCDFNLRTPVCQLRLAEQQMVEIAKALSQNPRVLVLDEPTSALSGHEADRLFAVIASLKAKGVALAYISHRMAEVFELGDRLTVLRDGKRIATMRPDATTPDEIVTMMVGRAVDSSYPRQFCETAGEDVLELRGVSAGNGIADIDMVIRRGEVVGLAGLAGSGRTEVARAIFGADRVTQGEILLWGKRFRGNPAGARRAGIALVPEDRKSQGLALIKSIQDNILMAGLERLFPSGWFKPKVAAAAASHLAGLLRIGTPSLNRAAGQLSGGNQQKTVIAKWLQADAKLFIFDEPTRGIDIGAKAEIFEVVNQLVAQGKAVLMISSELPEIISVCDRAYVMRGKRIAGELPRRELTQENVMRLATGHG